MVFVCRLIIRYVHIKIIIHCNTMIVTNCFNVTEYYPTSIRKRSGENGVVVTANMSYDQTVPVDEAGKEDSDYEDPIVLATSGYGQETIEPIENELSVGKLEAPVYASVDHCTKK